MDTLSLDCNRYTETLLTEAIRAGVYDEETAMVIRGRLFDLLAARLEVMTNGESCSVPAETAQALLSAVLYTLDMRLLAEVDADSAAERLQSVSPAELFDEGLHLIRRRLRAAELLYRKQLPLFESLPDSVMKTTAISGIAGFFRAYHPDGLADSVPITADYPLYLDMPMPQTVRGVSFLARYLQGLSDEARFLSKFRADTQDAVLSAADALYRISPTNLFAPMYANALGMVLLARPFSAWKYGLGGDAIAALQKMFDDGKFTRERLAAASIQIADLLMLERTTASYVLRSADKFYQSAVGCLRRHLPMLVFPCTDAAYRQKHRGASSALYEDLAFRAALGEGSAVSYHGGRMDAGAFRCLDYDLRSCTECTQKTKLILSRVQGLEDICDLLSADTGALDAEDRAHLLSALPEDAKRYLTEMMGVSISDLAGAE